MPGVTSMVSDISSVLNDIWGNIFSGMQMKQQGQQWKKQFGLQEKQFGLQEDQFALSKMLQEQGLYNQAEDRSWKRKFQKALGGVGSR